MELCASFSPSRSAVVVGRNPPLKCAEKCPAQSHILPRATASCAYKVNKQQRRWQGVEKVKRRKVKKPPKAVWAKQGTSTSHVLPLWQGAKINQGRTVRMSPCTQGHLPWAVTHGPPRWSWAQAEAGSGASPSKCVCSVPGVTLCCLSAVCNRELDEIISLGRCEVWAKCTA